MLDFVLIYIFADFYLFFLFALLFFYLYVIEWKIWLTLISRKNRLLSIAHDAKFVDSVIASYPTFKPVVNERCGTWYVNRRHAPISVYFKSTDGHTGQWSFSCRRLNLHLLNEITTCDGLIIVDSTRRGKRMPDALSKTIPIWIATLNKCVFERLRPHSFPNARLAFLPPFLPDTEKSSILQRLDGFVDSLMQSGIDLDALAAKLTKPIRPLWVTPASRLTSAQFEEYFTVVLVTASAQVQSGYSREHGFLYVQGAADDEEEWSHGLTPEVFWQNTESILTCPEEQLEQKISLLLSSTRNSPTMSNSSLTHLLPTPIFVGDVTGFYPPPENTSYFVLNLSNTTLNVKNELCFPIPSGKKGAPVFRKHFPSILQELNSLDPPFYERDAIFIVDEGNAKEAASCLALMILCLYYDLHMHLLAHPISLSASQSHLTKQTIRQFLVKITELHSKTNPSRAFLLAVNSLLLSANTIATS